MKFLIFPSPVHTKHPSETIVDVGDHLGICLVCLADANSAQADSSAKHAMKFHGRVWLPEVNRTGY